MTDVSPGHRWKHDLKNQISIVLGFSELLLNELDADSPHRGDVEEVHTAARRALDLLESGAPDEVNDGS